MFTKILVRLPTLFRRARAPESAPEQTSVETPDELKLDEIVNHIGVPLAKTAKNEERDPPDKREQAIAEKLVRFARVPASSIFRSVSPYSDYFSSLTGLQSSTWF